MEEYLRIVKEVMSKGKLKENRTGTKSYSVSGVMFEHDLSKGFPLLTTKVMPYRTIAVELEGFIKGITDKGWYQDRDCNIWDEWCNPKRVPYGHDEKTKKKMLLERDLGPIYGFQWRHWGADYYNYFCDYSNKGVDQLEKIVTSLKTNPNDRRMIINAWNVNDLDKMALPPCHYNLQFLVNDGKLDLLWNQRSVDVMLGLPFNIASYATLLHLLARESGLKEGKLVGFLGDTHIYENHLAGAEEQVSRRPYTLPELVTKEFKSIFDWDHKDTKVEKYIAHPKINYQVAV